MSIVWEVGAKPIQVSWSTPTTFEFDGEIHGITASVVPSSLAEGDDENSIVFTYSLEGVNVREAVEVGTYYATIIDTGNLAGKKHGEH